MWKNLSLCWNVIVFLSIRSSSIVEKFFKDAKPGNDFKSGSGSSPPRETSPTIISGVPTIWTVYVPGASATVNTVPVSVGCIVVGRPKDGVIIIESLVDPYAVYGLTSVPAVCKKYSSRIFHVVAFP